MKDRGNRVTTKEKLVEFLRPDKRKIILAFLLPLFWAIFILLFGILYDKLFPSEAIMVLPGIKRGNFPLLLFLASYLVQSLFYYPFACSVTISIDAFKEKRLKEIREDKKLFTLLILGIAFFNPVGWGILLLIFLVVRIGILKL